MYGAGKRTHTAFPKHALPPPCPQAGVPKCTPLPSSHDFTSRGVVAGLPLRDQSPRGLQTLYGVSSVYTLRKDAPLGYASPWLRAVPRLARMRRCSDHSPGSHRPSATQLRVATGRRRPLRPACSATAPPDAHRAVRTYTHTPSFTAVVASACSACMLCCLCRRHPWGALLWSPQAAGMQWGSGAGEGRRSLAVTRPDHSAIPQSTPGPGHGRGPRRGHSEGSGADGGEARHASRWLTAERTTAVPPCHVCHAPARHVCVATTVARLTHG